MSIVGVTTTTDECAEDVNRPPGAPCSSKRVLSALAGFLEAQEGEAPADGPALVERAEEALGCDGEACILAHPRFRQHVAADGGRAAGRTRPKARAPTNHDRIDLDAELRTRFKAPGPRDTTDLLTNHDIDETLRRWARSFPEFYPCPFAMMDFDRTRERFATIDLTRVLEGREPLDLGPDFGTVERPCVCFGCVVNTDVSSGPGKHWVAVFVDCRPAGGQPWTVEYFNSAGNPPPREMVRWMERTRAALARHRQGPVESVPVTDMRHQKSQTECGLYALYYIRCRLERVPYGFFLETPVPDADMTAFRRHCFR